jgi:hypothetical protein
MKLVDRLLMDARARRPVEDVTLTYADGSQKRMTAFEALVAICKDEPCVVATDQPEGSLVWAVFTGSGEDVADLVELSTQAEALPEEM